MKRVRERDWRTLYVGRHLLAINTTVILFEVEDACTDVIFLPLTDLALSIKVPDGFRERLNNVGPLGLKNIEDMMPRDDIRLTALERLVETKKADNIHGIGVETLPG